MQKQSQWKCSRASKRSYLRGLLRTGVVASLLTVSGTVFAQSDLPSFLPAPQSLALPEAPQLPSIPLPQVNKNAEAAKRVAKILGLKKANSAAPTFAAVSLPPFPSTTPSPTLSPSAAPSIVCSSGGKCDSSTSEPLKIDSNASQTVVFASAQETTSDHEVALPDDAASTNSEESLADSLTLEESLIDIEIPVPLAVPAAAPAQRLPEIVKRPPAMQLHIGGPSKPLAVQEPTTQEPAAQEAKFSLSDGEGVRSVSIGDRDNGTDKIVATSPVVALPSNPMKIQIEGEPGSGQAVPRNHSSVANTTIQVPSSTALPTQSTKLHLTKVESAKVPAATTATTAATVSSRVPAQKSASNKVADNAPVIGEQLDVGLHEATNVETAQVISGLSIEHPELCQVLKSGERTLSLVGLKPGRTRVALFTTNESGERKIEIREVVIAGTETRQTDMRTMATEISNTVHSMYPNSRIEIIAEAEGLTVQGYAGSEDEAKKIIGLVRRTSLQPVVDRLATYK